MFEIIVSRIFTSYPYTKIRKMTYSIRTLYFTVYSSYRKGIYTSKKVRFEYVGNKTMLIQATNFHRVFYIVNKVWNETL